MPVAHTIDQERALVVTTISGSVDVAELRTAILTVSQLPGFREDLGQLVDLSACTGIRATAAEVRMLADLQPARAARRAYVAPAPHVFGIARMYELLRDDGRMRIVRTLEEGLQWLAGMECVVAAGAQDGERSEARSASGTR